MISIDIVRKSALYLLPIKLVSLGRFMHLMDGVVGWNKIESGSKVCKVCSQISFLEVLVAQVLSKSRELLEIYSVCYEMF